MKRKLRRTLRAALTAALALTASCGSWDDAADCFGQYYTEYEWAIMIVPPWMIIGECLSDVAFGSAPTSQPLTGRYALQTIAGFTLPVGSTVGVYQAGSVELWSDGTFVDVIRIAGATDSLSGTYTLVGDSVKFAPVGWAAYAMRWDPHGALVARWNEGEFVYRREP